MKCQKCGTEIKQGAKFCGECGTAVNTNSNLTVCPHCGSPVKPGYQFCRKCGAKLQSNQPVEVIPRDLKEKLQKVSLDYYQAKKNNDKAKRDEYYSIVVQYIDECNKYLVKGGKKPFTKDESNIEYPYEKTILVLVALLNKFQNGVASDIHFDDIDKANYWLANTRGISKVTCTFNKGYRLGAIANRFTFKGVDIHYVQTNKSYDVIFQLQVVNKTNLFVSGKGKFIDNIKQINPNKTIVNYSLSSNARAQPGTLIFSMGLDYREHETYYIVYKKNRNDPTPLNLGR